MKKAQLTVDEIIDKVLIKNRYERHSYKQIPNNLTTNRQNIVNFQLQTENQELQERLVELEGKYKRQLKNRDKTVSMQRQIQHLKSKLNHLLHSNTNLQKEINKIRLQYSQVNSSIQNSLEDSRNRRKSVKDCLCSNNHTINSRVSSKHQKNHQKHAKSNIWISPQRNQAEINYEGKNFNVNDKGVECKIQKRNENEKKIFLKQSYLQSLQKIISEQAKLIADYQNSIKQNQQKSLKTDKIGTIASTNRLNEINRMNSLTEFKAISAVGSIVKIKRKQ